MAGAPVRPGRDGDGRGKGVLDGIEVLDLTWGISGPLAGMLLADHGARVTRIEPPGGDPFDGLSGSRVWLRGKRRATLDLADAADRERLLALVATADVLLVSWAPGVAEELGLGYEQLAALNPRLVHCSITGYGESGRHADRPAYDALVAARTGQQYESRGVVGGTIARLSGTEPILEGYEAPPQCMVGAPRPGPLFGGVPWPSLATFYNATLAISAALRAREVTGRGQHVHTSLLQGVLATTLGAWQRVERPDTPSFQTWVIDPRAPKGFFRASDGRWTHHWVPLPSFILNAGEQEELVPSEALHAPREAPMRVGTDADDMIVLHAFHDEMAAAVARFTAADWERLAAQVGVPVQIVRAPENALLDPALLEDGCVTEVDDPEVGTIRVVGRTYELSACPSSPARTVARPGEHTAEVRAEADAALAASPPTRALGTNDESSARIEDELGSPLEGVVVLDLGLAVAGPFGTQLLSDLGADVIKVNNGLFDSFWMRNHIAFCCNRGKRSITIDLKQTEGMEILHELVRRADVVQHNMRYEAAERLGVDYGSLRAINPALIYCHTRGHDRGPRELLPGNDQTGAALAGVSWMEGGVESGATPIWPVTSLGDTGNGYLSAIGIVQALYHRDRTGEGQFVDTAILNAHLLNASMAWVTPDGSTQGARPQLDAMQTGWSARYRLYETADGWLCLAVATDEQLDALAGVLGRDLPAGDDELGAVLTEAFATRSAREWVDALDAARVPAEESDPDFVLSLFDDPEMVEKGWVTSYEHPIVGRMDVAGLLFDLSDTPGRVFGPPIVPGQDTRTILAELGHGDEQVEKWLASGVVAERAF
jgi:crotonobetainyl-CoA:carnitine CoA-transferase CaiB-like acyl-CoA transferase